MYTIYKLKAGELDQRFLDSLKSQFQDREIEIVVSEAADVAEDETAYLLRSSANRDRLLKAIENVAQGRHLEVVDLDDPIVIANLAGSRHAIRSWRRRRGRSTR